MWRHLFSTLSALILGACALHSEDALRQQFAQHKNIIIQILEMQLQDSKVVRIAPTFTRLDNDWNWPRKDLGFSSERWDKYRALFERAGITDGIQNDGGYIWYYVSSYGLGMSGASRGFVYTKQPPNPVVHKISECPPGKGICYIALEESWYLFHWVT